MDKGTREIPYALYVGVPNDLILAWKYACGRRGHECSVRKLVKEIYIEAVTFEVRQEDYELAMYLLGKEHLTVDSCTEP